MEDATRPDREKLRKYSLHVFGLMNGATVAAMICLGDRLGLYAALAELGPATSAQLAEHTGLHERWVREWLYTQGAGGVLERCDDDRFALSPEAVAVLVDEAHPANGIGMFSQLPDLIRNVERLPDAFRSGLGLPYDALGSEGARGIERGLAPWFRSRLVSHVLPRIEGVSEKLTAGGTIADVGCGAGVALIEMAKAFPASRFHGYDISKHALERAEANRAAAGVENVELHDAKTDLLPSEARFDFVTTFDCLHDMTQPREMIRDIRRALVDDGAWLIADIRSQPTYAENVERNPMAAMMYAFSVMVCMSSSLSEPGGAGLGTLGLHEALLGEWTREAGFSQLVPLDLGHAVNAFYVVRP